MAAIVLFGIFAVLAIGCGIGAQLIEIGPNSCGQNQCEQPLFDIASFGARYSMAIALLLAAFISAGYSQKIRPWIPPLIGILVGSAAFVIFFILARQAMPAAG